MEGFRRLPRPDVVFHGAAIEAQGQQLIDVLELSANETHYLVVVSVPEAQVLPDGYKRLLCTVTPAGQVYMYGGTSSGSILVNPPTVHKKRRIQLCPSEQCGISFSLPGPADSLATEISSLPRRIMLRVRKQ